MRALRRCSFILTSSLLLAGIGVVPTHAVAHADDGPSVVAFPLVVGPKAAGRGKTAKGVTQALRRAGLEVLRGKPLVAAAEVLEVPVASVDVAEAVDADFLVVVRLERRGRRFVAIGQAFRTTDGAEIGSVERRYRSSRSAVANGRKLGSRLAETILADLEARTPAPPPSELLPEPAIPSSEPTVPEPRPQAPGPAPEVTPAAPAPTADPTSRARAEPSPTPARLDSGRGQREAPAVGTDVPAKARDASRGPERAVLKLSAGAGSRLYSAYTVSTQGTATGLSYTLDPLLTTELRAVVTLPMIPLGFDVDLGLRPVRFGLDTTPPLTPSEPSGQLLDVGAAVWWRFDLVELGEQGALTLAPMISADFGGRFVEEQVPDSIVSSSSTFTVGGGLRAGMEIEDVFALDLDGVAAPVLAFSESPRDTGQQPGGFRARARGRARLWFNATVGVQLAVGYDYRSVTLTGAATRAVFEQDPPLVDAEIADEAIDLTAALVLAL